VGVSVKVGVKVTVGVIDGGGNGVDPSTKDASQAKEASSRTRNAKKSCGFTRGSIE
jgi:hypothetical protein